MAENNESSKDMKSLSGNVDNNDSGKNNILDISKLKRKALENYSAFLESLDSNSLENEVKNPSFERNARNSIETFDTLAEGIYSITLSND